jgi:hypothetical protein
VTLRGRLAAIALAVMMSLLLVPGTASATSLEPWWYTALGVEKFHSEVTGKGVKIAVIDGALNADAPDLKGAKVTLRTARAADETARRPRAKSYPTAFYASHGTAMTTLLVGQGVGNAADGAGITGIAPDAEVNFYQMDPDPTDDDVKNSYSLFEQAIEDDVDIISFSFTNETGLEQVIQKAWDAGIVVVVGAGAEGGIVGEPASIPGVVSVGAVDKNAKPWKDQPQGQGDIVITAPGVAVASGAMKGTATDARWVSGDERTGTSPAAPLVAGALALVKQKYPQATGNQLVQQLIHRNGRASFGWDSKGGFGIISIGQMLETDPSGWPDVNPLLKGPRAAYEEFPLAAYRDPGAPEPAAAAPSTPAPEPADKPATAATADAGESRSSALPWIVGGAVLAGVLAAAIIIMRNRGRRSRHPVPTSSARGN